MPWPPPFSAPRPTSSPPLRHAPLAHHSHAARRDLPPRPAQCLAATLGRAICLTTTEPPSTPPPKPLGNAADPITTPLSGLRVLRAPEPAPSLPSSHRTHSEPPGVVNFMPLARAPNARAAPSRRGTPLEGTGAGGWRGGVGGGGGLGGWVGEGGRGPRRGAPAPRCSTWQHLGRVCACRQAWHARASVRVAPVCGRCRRASSSCRCKKEGEMKAAAQAWGAMV
jgi:hypothetical protein